MTNLSEILLTHNGKRQNALAWCKELGFPREKLYKRIYRLGKDAKFEDLFFTGSFEKRTLITYKGETLNSYEWDRKFGYPLETVRRRLRRGWTMEQIEVGHRSDSITYHYITRDGITDTERGWAKRQGIDYSLVRSRLNLGWTRDEALGFVKHDNKCCKRFTYRGETHSYAQWARKLGIPPDLFSTRVKAYEKHLITKKEVIDINACLYAKLNTRHYYKGKRYSIKQLLEMSGLDKSSFYDRLNKGWSIHRTMTTPPTDPGYSTRIRKQRIRDLHNIGVIV